MSAGAAFADIDNDGDPDLVITTVRAGVHLFEDDGHGHFKDISKQAGIVDNGNLDRIEVVWPSGQVQVVDKDLAPDRLLKITEPQ